MSSPERDNSSIQNGLVTIQQASRDTNISVHDIRVLITNQQKYKLHDIVNYQQDEDGNVYFSPSEAKKIPSVFQEFQEKEQEELNQNGTEMSKSAKEEAEYELEHEYGHFSEEDEEENIDDELTETTSEDEPQENNINNLNDDDDDTAKKAKKKKEEKRKRERKKREARRKEEQKHFEAQNKAELNQEKQSSEYESTSSHDENANKQQTNSQFNYENKEPVFNNPDFKNPTKIFTEKQTDTFSKNINNFESHISKEDSVANAFLDKAKKDYDSVSKEEERLKKQIEQKLKEANNYIENDYKSTTSSIESNFEKLKEMNSTYKPCEEMSKSAPVHVEETRSALQRSVDLYKQLEKVQEEKQRLEVVAIEAKYQSEFAKTNVRNDVAKANDIAAINKYYQEERLQQGNRFFNCAEASETTLIKTVNYNKVNSSIYNYGDAISKQCNDYSLDSDAQENIKQTINTLNLNLVHSVTAINTEMANTLNSYADAQKQTGEIVQQQHDEYGSRIVTPDHISAIHENYYSSLRNSENAVINAERYEAICNSTKEKSSDNSSIIMSLQAEAEKKVAETNANYFTNKINYTKDTFDAYKERTQQSITESEAILKTLANNMPTAVMYEAVKSARQFSQTETYHLTDSVASAMNNSVNAIYNEAYKEKCSKLPKELISREDYVHSSDAAKIKIEKANQVYQDKFNATISYRNSLTSDIKQMNISKEEQLAMIKNINEDASSMLKNIILEKENSLETAEMQIEASRYAVERLDIKQLKDKSESQKNALLLNAETNHQKQIDLIHRKHTSNNNIDEIVANALGIKQRQLVKKIGTGENISFALDPKTKDEKLLILASAKDWHWESYERLTEFSVIQVANTAKMLTRNLASGTEAYEGFSALSPFVTLPVSCIVVHSLKSAAKQRAKNIFATFGGEDNAKALLALFHQRGFTNINLNNITMKDIDELFKGFTFGGHKMSQLSPAQLKKLLSSSNSLAQAGAATFIKNLREQKFMRSMAARHQHGLGFFFRRCKQTFFNGVEMEEGFEDLKRYFNYVRNTYRGYYNSVRYVSRFLRYRGQKRIDSLESLLKEGNIRNYDKKKKQLDNLKRKQAKRDKRATARQKRLDDLRKRIKDVKDKVKNRALNTRFGKSFYKFYGKLANSKLAKFIKKIAEVMQKTFSAIASFVVALAKVFFGIILVMLLIAIIYLFIDVIANIYINHTNYSAMYTDMGNEPFLLRGYCRLHRSTLNAEDGTTIRPGGISVNTNWYSNLKEIKDNPNGSGSALRKEEEKHPSGFIKPEYDNFNHTERMPVTFNNSLLNFYSSDGNRISEHLLGVSNARTILTIADVRLNYGINKNEDEMNADEIAEAQSKNNGWSYRQYENYLDKLFEETHRVGISVSPIIACNGSDCQTLEDKVPCNSFDKMKEIKELSDPNRDEYAHLSSPSREFVNQGYHLFGCYDQNDMECCNDVSDKGGCIKAKSYAQHGKDVYICPGHPKTTDDTSRIIVPEKKLFSEIKYNDDSKVLQTANCTLIDDKNEYAEFNPNAKEEMAVVHRTAKNVNFYTYNFQKTLQEYMNNNLVVSSDGLNFSYSSNTSTTDTLTKANDFLNYDYKLVIDKATPLVFYHDDINHAINLDLSNSTSEIKKTYSAGDENYLVRCEKSQNPNVPRSTHYRTIRYGGYKILVEFQAPSLPCQHDVPEIYRTFRYSYCPGHEIHFCSGHKNVEVAAVVSFASDEINNNDPINNPIKLSQTELEAVNAYRKLQNGETLSTEELSKLDGYSNKELRFNEMKNEWNLYKNTSPVKKIINRDWMFHANEDRYPFVDMIREKALIACPKCHQQISECRTCPLCGYPESDGEGMSKVIGPLKENWGITTSSGAIAYLDFAYVNYNNKESALNIDDFGGCESFKPCNVKGNGDVDIDTGSIYQKK